MPKTRKLRSPGVRIVDASASSAPCPAPAEPVGCSRTHHEPKRSVPRVGVIGYFGGGNFGDDLLSCCMLDFLCSFMSAKDVVVVSHRGRYLERWYPGVQCRRLPELLSCPEKSPERLVLGGGGLIYNFRGASFANGFGFRPSTPFRLVRAMGWRAWRKTPMWAFCLGIGPLCGWGSRLAAKLLVRHCDSVSVRDSASRDLLLRLGCAGQVVTDPVVGLAPLCRRVGAPIPNTLAIVVRHWEFANWTESLINTLLESARRLRSEDWTVEFFIFDQAHDAPVLEQLVASRESPRVWNPDEDNVEPFLRCLGSFGVVLSMRAHGLLLGTLLGSASIAIGLEPKLEAFARRWGTVMKPLSPNATTDDFVSGVKEAQSGRVGREFVQGESKVLHAELANLRAWLEASHAVSLPLS